MPCVAQNSIKNPIPPLLPERILLNHHKSLKSGPLQWIYLNSLLQYSNHRLQLQWDKGAKYELIVQDAEQ
jgi:hypothetical protein